MKEVDLALRIEIATDLFFDALARVDEGAEAHWKKASSTTTSYVSAEYKSACLNAAASILKTAISVDELRELRSMRLHIEDVEPETRQEENEYYRPLGVSIDDV